MSSSNSSNSGASNQQSFGWVSVPNTWTITVNPTIYNPATYPVNPPETPPEPPKKKSEGCACKKCKEFYNFAEPNQDDGTLICWSCRHGY